MTFNFKPLYCMKTIELVTKSQTIYQKATAFYWWLTHKIESLFSLNQIGTICFILFGMISFWGFSMQIECDFIYKFSFGNVAVVTVSALFIITMSQFFLIKDKAFLYYGLYLFLNICYFHYTTLGVENKEILPHYVHYFVGLILIGGYYLYMKFAIYFLNLEKEYPAFAKRLHFYAFLILILLILDTLWMVYMQNDARKSLVGRMIIIFGCIPIGFIGICECFMKLRGLLAYIFLGGSTLYFVGSVLGFLFASGLILNPFTNPMMKHWTFFTESGTILEVVFFSTGLAYRMGLIEVEKQKIEKELLLKRVNELETEQALLLQRERISHDLHDDVGTTLNSISVFSAIALQEARIDNPNSMTVLTRIGEASRHLIESLNDIVWVINPQNDRFENVIVKMRLFAADLLMPNNIQLHFNADESLNNVHLSIEQRKHFYLIFKEAINNVFKYANCNELNVNIHFLNKKITMQIADNGDGFDTINPKNGNGLKTMQKRADILRGPLSIVSNKEKGTTISLSFPVN
jgi:signal transduction histidine kinase